MTRHWSTMLTGPWRTFVLKTSPCSMEYHLTLSSIWRFIANLWAMISVQFQPPEGFERRSHLQLVEHLDVKWQLRSKKKPTWQKRESCSFFLSLIIYLFVPTSKSEEKERDLSSFHIEKNCLYMSSPSSCSPLIHPPSSPRLTETWYLDWPSFSLLFHLHAVPYRTSWLTVDRNLTW